MMFSNAWHPSERYDEWWYFALFCDDGTLISGNLEIRNNKPGVWVFIDSKGQSPVYVKENFSYNKFKASKEFCDIRIGDNSISEDKDGFSVDMTVKGCSVSVKVKKLVDWKDNVIQKDFNVGSASWIVPCVKGSFEGEMCIKGEKKVLKGFAFHDHLWHDFSLKNFFDFDEWFWGVGYSKDSALLFGRVSLKKDSFSLLYLKDKDKTFFLKEGNENKRLRFVRSGRKTPERIDIMMDGKVLANIAIEKHSGVSILGDGLAHRLLSEHVFGLSHNIGKFKADDLGGKFYSESLVKRRLI